MGDLSRPVAPYLPPEITSRILYYIPLELETRSKVAQEYQSISVLTRISGSFGVEALKKLVSSIYLVSIDQLRKLVDNLSPRLLSQTKSLRFDTMILEPDHPTLIHSVLRSTKNLQHLQIDGIPSPFSFDSNQTHIMRRTIMLPHLKSLQVTINDPAILDLIVSTAPNIEKLTVATQRYNIPYVGVSFTSHLDKLKELTLYGGAGTGILEGSRWQLNEFRGLTFIKLVNVGFKPSNVLEFFKVIGPTPQEAQLERIDPSFFESMFVLRRLSITKPLFKENILALPITITNLLIEFLYGPESPWLRLTQLRVLRICNLATPMNFSTLTALEVVIIGFAPAEIILRSLKHLVAGIFHGKLKLGFILNTGENLVDKLEIKERCKELRIELVKSNHEEEL